MEEQTAPPGHVEGPVTPEALLSLSLRYSTSRSRLRTALRAAADRIVELEAQVYATDNLAKTIGALVIAAGGRISVEPWVLQNLDRYSLARAAPVSTTGLHGGDHERA
mgnify:CR=1 FL=1